MFSVIEWQYVFQAWILLAVIQLVTAPLLVIYLHKEVFDAGWGWGRASGWLCISLCVWFLAHIGIPINTNLGILFTCIWLLLAAVWAQHSYWPKFIGVLRKKWPTFLLQEVLFSAGFIGMVLVRAHNSDILDLEKFMDAGFMMAYTRAPVLPAMDMWLAGESINYYTFGHFMGSVLQRFWGIPLAYSYNLLLGVVAGLVLQHAFSFITTLLAAVYPSNQGTRSITIAGSIGALFVTIGGNSHIAWFYLKNHSLLSYWYPDATRFIENTIHEFPAYSFIVSDLHAHVWSLPYVLLSLGIFWLWLRQLLASMNQPIREAWKTLLHPSIVAGGMLGVFVMMNTWDTAIYGMFLGVMGSILLIRSRKLFVPLVLSAGIMGLSALVIASPWILTFESISEGVRRVTVGSPFWQLVALWGGHVTLAAGAVIVSLSQLRKKKLDIPTMAALLVIGLAITALLLLIIPELMYVKDIYPGHPRANTMFKLTFQAFVLMGLLGGWFVGYIQLRSEVGSIMRVVGTSIVGLALIAFLAYPKVGFPSYYGNWETPKGLDGLAWLKRDEPEAYAMIHWLEKLPGRPVIVEAVGDSYTTFNRISAFTGLPTIVGWRVHEWLWRGGYEIPGARSEEVRVIYEDPDSPLAKQILKKYEVTYIIVGAREREAHVSIDEAGLQRLGPRVFNSGAAYILAVK